MSRVPGPFFPRRPSESTLRRILDAARDAPYAYPEVGHTRIGAPPGWPVNHHRLRVGTGAADFARAAEAVHAWAMYDIGWTWLFPARPAVVPGTVFAPVVRHFGFWSANPCRVVSVDEEEHDGVVMRGFTIGTLRGHAERGEERFRVEWHRADDAVWFDLFAFAAGNHWMTRTAQPLMTMLIRRFGRQACRAVADAVRG